MIYLQQLITVSQYVLLFTKCLIFQFLLEFFNGVIKVISCNNLGGRRVIRVVGQYNVEEQTDKGTKWNTDYTGRFRVAKLELKISVMNFLRLVLVR